mmetsp:Transcript_34549/g.81847  ORF Transcript_34549/g.81847 Transcript_34549/m.81847 type:complete len:407 (+) Transcript_34549:256-1476(+)
MRPEEDGLARELRRNLAQRDVRDLVRGVQPLAERKGLLEVGLDRIEALSVDGAHRENLLDHALAVVGEPRAQLDLLRKREQQRLALPLQLVHLVEDDVEALPPLAQPPKNQLLVGVRSELKRLRRDGMLHLDFALARPPPARAARDHLVGVDEEEDLVGVARRVPRRLHHRLVEALGGTGVHDARRVDEDQLGAARHGNARHGVARGLALVSHDRDLAPDHEVQQRALAGVGRAQNRDSAAAFRPLEFVRGLLLVIPAGPPRDGAEVKALSRGIQRRLAFLPILHFRHEGFAGLLLILLAENKLLVRFRNVFRGGPHGDPGRSMRRGAVPPSGRTPLGAQSGKQTLQFRLFDDRLVPRRIPSGGEQPLRRWPTAQPASEKAMRPERRWRRERERRAVSARLLRRGG